MGDASSVRGPHWDSPRKLWIRLFYLRNENESEGGDLMLYDSASEEQSRKPNGSTAKTKNSACLAVQPVKTVKYEPNRLFMGLNTEKATTAYP